MRDRYYGEFESLRFVKTGSQIIEKAQQLREKLGAKVKEREDRIRSVATEAGFKDATDVFLSLQTIADGTSGQGDINMSVGLAGKVKAEVGALNEERKEIDRLRLIIENLRPEDEFKLSFPELRYFGW